MKLEDIPIITYHKISNENEFGLTTVTLKKFAEQIKFLFESGYSSITFVDYLKGKIPPKPIIISFDDTYQNIFKNAFPVLKQYNYNAVLFIIANFIGKMNEWEAYKIQRKFRHADASEINIMISNGYEIASHGLSHSYLPSLSSEKLNDELLTSKNFLENLFQKEILTFSYPYGKYSKKVLDQVTNAGYQFATTNANIFHKKTYRNLNLQRRSIYRNDSLKTFMNKVNMFHVHNYNFYAEWLIQKGAYVGIIKKLLIDN